MNTPTNTSAPGYRYAIVAGVALVAGLAGGCAATSAPPGGTSGATSPGATDGAVQLEQTAQPEQAAQSEQPAQPGQADPPTPDDTHPPVVRIQDIPLDPALITTVRSDPSLQGAIDTALLYLAAWLHGINTGDPTLLTELSTGDCQYCTATVARLATDPRTVADGFSTQMAATLFASEEPDADHDYAVVSLGVQVDSAQVTDVGGVQTMQMLEPMTAGFRFAVQSTPSGWAIGGIANEEWDGSA